MAVGRILQFGWNILFTGNRLKSYLALLGLIGLANLNSNAMTLAWDANQEPDIAGYKLYYAAAQSSYLVVDAGNKTTLTLNSLDPGKTYTFYVTAYNTAGLESDPSKSITYSAPQPSSVVLDWQHANSPAFSHYMLSFGELHDPSTLTNFTTKNTSWTFSNLKPGTGYFFWVNAYDTNGLRCDLYRPIGAIAEAGQSSYSEYCVSALYSGWERNDGGDWVGKYGSKGYLVASEPDKASPVFGPINNGTYWVWSANSSDPGAMETADGKSRVAATWYSNDELSIPVHFTDNQIHRVTLFLLDYEQQGLVQYLDFDEPIGNFGWLSSPGMHVFFDVKGSAVLRFSKTSGPYVAISGLFAD
jgi:hypothetical protein